MPAKKKRRKYQPVTYSEEDFEVKPSVVPEVGLGLFTKINLRKGDTVGYYTGKVLNDAQADLPKYCDSLYLLWVCKDHWIWGEGKLANYTRYINHSYRPNLELVVSTRWKTARFCAVRNVAAGSELYFDYGPDYWEGIGFKPKKI